MCSFNNPKQYRFAILVSAIGATQLPSLHLQSQLGQKDTIVAWRGQLNFTISLSLVLQAEEYFHHSKNTHTIKILKFYMTTEKMLPVLLETVEILFVVVNW